MKWRSLRKKSDFQKVYDKGVKRVGRLVVVYLLSADDTAGSVVASRKIGSAVKRNRAKRLLREALRNGLLGQPGGVTSVCERFFPDSGGDPSLRSGEPGLWVVLVARYRILDAKAQDVRDELNDLLSRH